MSDARDFQTVERQFARWFRNSSPYINAFRDRTFVIVFQGDALLSDSFANIVHDIALLNSLGIRLVLVHGARPQIEMRLRERQAEMRYQNGIRITDHQSLECVKEACGSIHVTIQALLSMGLANSPMAGAQLKALSGNFVFARPLGIHDGVDYQFTGRIRRIDSEAINRCLNDNNIVVVPPLGYSLTGEVFNLTALEVASAAASALHADKLICLIDTDGITGQRDELIRQLTVAQAEQILNDLGASDDVVNFLRCAITACQGGVKRAHLINRHIDGALLMELFTRDGIGTLITVDTYEGIRNANVEDIPGILELIEPLEKAGVLVRRSRELLENEIDRFTVVERDGMIIACTACYPFADQNAAELACLAVHPDYQNRGYGDTLLQTVVNSAKRSSITRLFVLTTQASHWFQERGFVSTTPDALPDPRRQLYNYQRGSKVYLLTI